METVEASDYIFKVIAVGDASVGKTSLTLRFATDKFESDYKLTLGLNLTNKNVKINDDGSEMLISLSIWDTGGQKSFAPLLPMYYKGALGALIIYDLTKRQTFDAVDEWVEDVKKHCEEIPIVIIGNKNDLTDQIKVTTQEGTEKVNQIKTEWKNDVFFFETSAKEDVKVNESFKTLASTILKIVKEEEDVEEPTFGTQVRGTN